MKNILVVDDEPDVKFLFDLRFRKEIKQGLINFIYVHSAQEALSHLHDFALLPDKLILSDINMPGMSGFELLEKVLEEVPKMHVIMITAYGDKANETKAQKMGAKEFVTKPVDFNFLRKLIFEP
ncbi:MAG TPA: response regulator [Bacteroidia bacterium]|nr:response regulator [Bacteroidia bacterium]